MHGLLFMCRAQSVRSPSVMRVTRTWSPCSHTAPQTCSVPGPVVTGPCCMPGPVVTAWCCRAHSVTGKHSQRLRQAPAPAHRNTLAQGTVIIWPNSPQAWKRWACLREAQFLSFHSQQHGTTLPEETTLSNPKLFQLMLQSFLNIATTACDTHIHTHP
jgi:hypothetical protein